MLPFLELEVSKRGKKIMEKQNTFYDLHVKDRFTLFVSLQSSSPLLPLSLSISLLFFLLEDLS